MSKESGYIYANRANQRKKIGIHIKPYIKHFPDFCIKCRFT